MHTLKELIRNHLIAATMHGRWETLTEIKVAIHKEDGQRFERKDIWKNLFELSKDGIHTLEFRKRGGLQKNYKEYRLRVKPEAVMETKKFERESFKYRRA